MMDRKSEQIAEALLKDIRAGRYEDRLPSEKELAGLYHTSPVTAAKSLNLLRDRRVVTRVSGKGSFVNRAGMKRIRVHLSLPETIQRELEALLERRFGGAVELSCDYCEGFWDEYDLFFRTAYVPFEYGLKLSPLPGNFLEYVGDSNYYGKAFGAHLLHDRYYGVPYMMSPVLTAVNLDLLDRLGMTLPRRGFTPSDLKELRKRLQKSGGKLFDTTIYNKSLLLYFMFARLKPKADCEVVDLGALPWNDWKKMLEDFNSLIAPDIAAGADFNNGDTLFRLIARQDIAKNRVSHDFAWDITSLPFGDGSPATMAAEYIMISNSSANPALCMETAEFFLDKSVQELLGRHRYGLPILKSAALASMDTSDYRDDLFFSEAERSVYHYHLMDKAFLNPMLEDLGNYFSGKTAFEQLLPRIAGLYELNHLNRDKALVSMQPDMLL